MTSYFVSNARVSFVDSDGVLTKFGRDILTKIAGTSIKVVSANYTTTGKDEYIVIETANTVYLNASPKDGEVVQILCVTSGTTVNGNGKDINNAVAAYLTTTAYEALKFMYSYEKDQWYMIN